MNLKKNKRECPECREMVDYAANYCPFCRYEFVKPITGKTTKLESYSFQELPTSIIQPSFLCSGSVVATDMTHVYEQIENCNDKIYVTRTQYHELLRDSRTFSSYDDPNVYFCGKQLIILG